MVVVTQVDSKLVVAQQWLGLRHGRHVHRLNNIGLDPTGFIHEGTDLDDVFFKILGEDKEESHANSH